MSEAVSYGALILAFIAIIVAVIAIILIFIYRPTDAITWTTSTVTPSDGTATISVAPDVIFLVNSGSNSTDSVDLSFNTGDNGSFFGVQNTGSGVLNYGSGANAGTIPAGTIQMFFQSSGSVRPVIGAN